MSTERETNPDGTPADAGTGQEAATVEALGALREAIAVQVDDMNKLRSLPGAKVAGREISLVITKLEEARMWAGMSLKFYNTGFKGTDLPGKPETFSKLVA